ncbi:MAG: hypothetical protein EA417_18715 [Gammaproteobacteria bacterium]|nr:MAG: hypothetical protein EA417_18715 [Gammaproteobacteria bacterium]
MADQQTTIGKSKFGRAAAVTDDFQAATDFGGDDDIAVRLPFDLGQPAAGLWGARIPEPAPN